MSVALPSYLTTKERIDSMSYERPTVTSLIADNRARHQKSAADRFHDLISACSSCAVGIMHTHPDVPEEDDEEEEEQTLVRAWSRPSARSGMALVTAVLEQQ